MADSTNITIRMDSDIKKDAEELFNELGLNMTTAINMFIRRSLVEGGIPFEVKRKQPNSETIEAMMECEQMLRDGTGKAYKHKNLVSKKPT